MGVSDIFSSVFQIFKFSSGTMEREEESDEKGGGSVQIEGGERASCSKRRRGTWGKGPPPRALKTVPALSKVSRPIACQFFPSDNSRSGGSESSFHLAITPFGGLESSSSTCVTVFRCCFPHLPVVNKFLRF